jgi:uncharacterized protein YciI
MDAFSKKITVVVYGDLASKVVTDPRREYSKKLVGAERERDDGRHVCVVDAAGFSKLLQRTPAPCLKLRSAQPSAGQNLFIPRVGDGILGDPLREHRIPERDTIGLAVDLDALDEGTKAHEETVAALKTHLEQQRIVVCGPARNAPKFDAGWFRDGQVFIAEVKSLTGAHEAQQIRLGVGQVLDYAHQLGDGATGETLRPALVLERQPAATRWAMLAQAHGILLTWGPNFPGC